MITIKEPLLTDTFDLIRGGAEHFRKAPVGIRKTILRQMEQWVLGHREEIQQALMKDLKKPASEADISEIYPVLSEIRHTQRNLLKWASPARLSGSLPFLGTRASIHYEPKGACLLISPWNYPFLLAVGPIVSAIAAGNTFVLKPSEYTPSTNAVIRELISALFSPETGILVEGEADVAKELLRFPFDHIFFTGSPAVGRIIMEAAARHLTSVTLELGGKSPTIVDETADLEDAAQKVAWGKWLNAGQTCVAPDYLFIHESRKEPFLRLLKEQTERLYGSEDRYTGIINKRHFDRLNTAIQNALSANATIEFGGEADQEACRIGPLVLSGISDDMDLMEQEIFGPVLPVMTFTSLDDVSSFVRARPKPLALYLFSRSRKNQRKIMQETSSGSMVINDCVLQFGHPTLPFGGVNNSGLGKAHGRAGFVAFSNEKSILKQRIGFTMAKTVYPPYSGLKKTMINFMLRYF